MASVVGLRYGRRRWPNTKKTLEGTAAGIVASLVVSAVLYIWCPSSLASTTSQMLGYAICLTLAGKMKSRFDHGERGGWANAVMGVSLPLWVWVWTGVMEALTLQIDNVTIPLFQLALVQLLV